MFSSRLGSSSIHANGKIDNNNNNNNKKGELSRTNNILKITVAQKEKYVKFVYELKKVERARARNKLKSKRKKLTRANLEKTAKLFTTKTSWPLQINRTIHLIHSTL